MNAEAVLRLNSMLPRVRFTDDLDTDEWYAIGDPEGPFQLGGGGVPFSITNIDRTGASVQITWASSDGESFTVERSTDFVDWNEAQDGVASGGDSTSFTFENVTEDEEYYRVIRE